MLKKEAKQTARLSIAWKCGDCIHFQKFAKFEKVCSKLGVTDKALAPSCFSPNVFALQKVAPDVLNQIGLLVKDLSTTQSRILMGVLKSRKAFQRYGLAFGMPVYICFGADYLNNYYKGFVIGVASHGDPMVYVTSDLNKAQINRPAILALLKDSVYNVVKFRAKKQELIKKKRLNDPKNTGIFGSNIKKPTVDVGYEPPSMDQVPASWFDAYARRVGKKQSKKGKLEFKV